MLKNGFHLFAIPRCVYHKALLENVICLKHNDFVGVIPLLPKIGNSNIIIYYQLKLQLNKTN